jgi:hypothetical protein
VCVESFLKRYTGVARRKLAQWASSAWVWFSEVCPESINLFCEHFLPSSDSLLPQFWSLRHCSAYRRCYRNGGQLFTPFKWVSCAQTRIFSVFGS